MSVNSLRSCLSRSSQPSASDDWSECIDYLCVKLQVRSYSSKYRFQTSSFLDDHSFFSEASLIANMSERSSSRSCTTWSGFSMSNLSPFLKSSRSSPFRMPSAFRISAGIDIRPLLLTLIFFKIVTSVTWLTLLRKNFLT